MGQNIKVIALDLEGTLISNAISQIPRPHLHAFLGGCKDITDRVVMFTTVSEDRFREIAQLLVSESVVPPWFSAIEYINWHGKTKDLNFIPDSIASEAVLVDDVAAYIATGQEKQWIEVQQFSSPYFDTDNELPFVLQQLQNYPN